MHNLKLSILAAIFFSNIAPLAYAEAPKECQEVSQKLSTRRPKIEGLAKRKIKLSESDRTKYYGMCLWGEAFAASGLILAEEAAKDGDPYSVMENEARRMTANQINALGKAVARSKLSDWLLTTFGPAAQKTYTTARLVIGHAAALAGLYPVFSCGEMLELWEEGVGHDERMKRADKIAEASTDVFRSHLQSWLESDTRRVLTRMHRSLKETSLKGSSAMFLFIDILLEDIDAKNGAKALTSQDVVAQADKIKGLEQKCVMEPSKKVIAKEMKEFKEIILRNPDLQLVDESDTSDRTTGQQKAKP